ncbi:MAG: MTAP family purine nucleoside phosphorylase [Candidatus Margulisiibacteriota bacterium]|nr:MTAP family purine nucleoside phosphorylase [Candidatus Margulisiibacteriota bacterium]
MAKVGIIGGSGVEGLLFSKGFKTKTIKTGYGPIKIEHGEVAGKEIFFIRRHGEHYVLPYQVNYRGNVAALKKLGVGRIIATAAVGCISPKMKPGDFAVLDDFIDFTKRRHETFSENAFIDVSSPYDRQLTDKILSAAGKLKLKVDKKATYVCTEGPRFESRAEIKMFGKMGADVVGMTQAAEVVLAVEAQIPYAVIAVVTNYAAGIKPKKITSKEVFKMMKEKKNLLSRLLTQTIKTL